MHQAPFAPIAPHPGAHSGLGAERLVHTKPAPSSRKSQSSKPRSATSSQSAASTKTKKTRQPRGSACNPCNRASKKCIRDLTKPQGSMCLRCESTAEECFIDTTQYVDKATRSGQSGKEGSQPSGSRVSHVYPSQVASLMRIVLTFSEDSGLMTLRPAQKTDKSNLKMGLSMGSRSLKSRQLVRSSAVYPQSSKIRLDTITSRKANDSAIIVKFVFPSREASINS